MIIFSIFREVLRRPLGAVSAAVLVALYAAAVFADFFAPYATNEQDLERTYHPPTALIFQRWWLASSGLRISRSDRGEV